MSEPSGCSTSENGSAAFMRRVILRTLGQHCEELSAVVSGEGGRGDGHGGRDGSAEK